MKNLSDPVSFDHGPAMRNRFFLAPLTNMQSLPDGRMSDDEYRWLAMRAEHGGFGATMTCAANIRADSQGVVRQLGIYDDIHVPPLRRIARTMKAHGNVAFAQLNHSGLRADPRIIGTNPMGPYDEPSCDGRAMSTWEVQQAIEDFICAAKRADQAGFDGVEVHGAHSQLLAQFLNPVKNLRSDGYGGSLEDRSRALREVLLGIRQRCRPDFIVGLRMCPERFELRLSEFRTISQEIMTSGMVDFMDFSLWSVFKEPAEEEFKGRPLIAWVANLERGSAKLGVAGKITTGATARACIEAGADFVVIGRGAILHHDFPKQVAANPDFVAVPLPVSTDYLHTQCVSDNFIVYLRQWDNFVADAPRGVFTDIGDMVDGSVVLDCRLDEADAKRVLIDA